MRQHRTQVPSLRVTQPDDHAARVGEHCGPPDELLQIAEIVDASKIRCEIGRGLEKTRPSRCDGSRFTGGVECHPNLIGLAVAAGRDVEVHWFDIPEVHAQGLGRIV